MQGSSELRVGRMASQGVFGEDLRSERARIPFTLMSTLVLVSAVVMDFGTEDMLWRAELGTERIVSSTCLVLE